MQRRQELWELKQRDPEAFKVKITELRNSAQKRLDTLKETDPEAYERVIERRQRRIQPRFERFREENPQAYARIEGHREGLIQKRYEWFKQHDPAKFEQIERRRETWKAERAAHPEWRGRWERQQPPANHPAYGARVNADGWQRDRLASDQLGWGRPEQPRPDRPFKKRLGLRRGGLDGSSGQDGGR